MTGKGKKGGNKQNNKTARHAPYPTPPSTSGNGTPTPTNRQPTIGSVLRTLSGGSSQNSIGSPRPSSSSSLTIDVSQSIDDSHSDASHASPSMQSTPTPTMSAAETSVEVSRSVRERKKSSWVWAHFTPLKEDKNRCKCNYCPATYEISGTGTMSRHLHAKHPGKISTTNQATMDKQLKLVSPFKFDMELAHAAFVDFLLLNNHEFCLGKQIGFDVFCQRLNPLYITIGPTAVKARVMVRYVALLHKVILILVSDETGELCWTTDLWSSPNHVSFMGITCGWMDSGFNVHDIVVGFGKLIGEHSGVNIARHFYERLESLGVTHKVSSITTDNASSNGTFIEEFIELTKNSVSPFQEEKWIRCFAHIINLAVQSAIDPMRPMFDKLRRLVVAIRATSQRIDKFTNLVKKMKLDELDDAMDEQEYNDLLELIQAMPDGVLPILDVVTRWSSTYLFIKRALRLFPALEKMSQKSEFIANQILPEDKKKIEEAFAFLKPFAESTKFIEAARYPTITMVVPLFNKLLDFTEDWKNNKDKSDLSREGAARAFDKLAKYYEKVAALLMAATFMDPRCKLKYFEVNGWEQGSETTNSTTSTEENLIESRVMPAIHRAWAKYKDMEIPVDQNGATSREDATDTSKRATEPSFMDDIFCGPTINAEVDELQQYMDEPLEARNIGHEGVSRYWKYKSNKWPRLAKMAQDLLPIPATSASSERSFSVGRDVFGLFRMSLLPETVEALVCLRSWLRSGILVGKDAAEAGELVDLLSEDEGADSQLNGEDK